MPFSSIARQEPTEDFYAALSMTRASNGELCTLDSGVAGQAAAGVLTKVAMKVVEPTNAGTPFGIAADKIKSYSRAGLSKPKTNLDAANANNDAALGGDFVLRTV